MLLERIANQRVALRAAARGMRECCASADRVVSVVSRGVRQPWLLAASAIAIAIVSARHRRLVRWMGYLATGVSLYARLRRSLSAK